MKNKTKKRSLRIVSLILAVLLYALPGLNGIAYAAAPITNTAYMGYTGSMFSNSYTSTSNTTSTDYAKAVIIPQDNSDSGEQSYYAHLPRIIQNIGSIADTFAFRGSNSLGAENKFYRDTGIIGTYEPGIDTAEISEAYLAVNETFAYITAVYVPETTTVGTTFNNSETAVAYNFEETPAAIIESNAMDITGTDTVTVINTIPPSAPHLLYTDTALHAGAVRLIWDTSNYIFDLDYYNIYRSTVHLGPYDYAGTAPYTPTYYDDVFSIQVGVTYFYVATAVDSYGNLSDTSNEVPKLILDMTPPDTPVISSIVRDTYGRALTLNWGTDTQGDTDLMLVRIIRSTNSVFDTYVSVDIATDTRDIAIDTDNVYYDSGLVNGQTYFYRVYREDIYGLWSDYSESYAVPEDERAPNKQTGLSAVADTRGHRIDLSWTNDTDTDIVELRIYRSTDNMNYAIADTFAAGTTQYADTGLTNLQTYYYYITAADTRYYSLAQDTYMQNESVASDTVTEVAIDLVPPENPFNGSISRNIPERTAALQWDYNDTETDFYRFRIYRSTNSGTFTLIASSPDTTYADTTITSVTRDSAVYRVTAIDTWNNESDSIVLGISTMVPGYVSATGIETGAQALVSWTLESDTDMQYIRIYRSTDAVAFSNVDTFAVSVTSYINSGLTNEQTYYYRITALDTTQSFESIASDSTFVYVQDTVPPSIPSALTIDRNIPARAVTVQWTYTGTDYSKFKIYRSTDSVNFSQIDTVSVKYFTDTGITALANDTVIYAVSAIDTWNNESDSALVSADSMKPGVIYATNYETGNAANLMWTIVDDSSYVKYVKIYRSTDAAAYSNVDTVSYSVTQYLDTGLQNLQTYYYYFASLDVTQAFESIQSDSTFVYVQDTVPPSKPAGLTAAADTSNISIVLNWSGDITGDAANYKIYRSTADTAYAQIATVPAPQTYYADTGLRNLQTYYYYITALDTYSNESISSDTASAVAIDLVAPKAPDTIAMEKNIPARLVTLIWTASDTDFDRSAFVIERSTNDSTFVRIAATADSVYNDTTITLLNQDTVFYRIAATDSYANISSYLYDTISVMKPGQITAAADTAGRTVHLQWTLEPDTHIVFVKIYRATIAGSFAGIDTVSAAVTQYTDSGLANFATYYYKFTALDSSAANESIFSDSTVVYTIDTVAPDTPLNLAATADTLTQTINLTWASDTNADITEYLIYRATTTLTFTQIDTITVPSTPYYSDTTVVFQGNTYYYFIKASDTYGNVSDTSNSASAYASDVIAPTAPFNLTAANLGDSNLLVWQYDTATPDLTGFKIYRSTQDTGVFTLVKTLNTVVTQWYDVNLDSSVLKQYYFVTANDTVGNESDSSNIAEASILNILSARAVTGKKFRITLSRTLTGATPDTNAVEVVSADGSETLTVESISIAGALLEIKTTVQTQGDSYIITMNQPVVPVRLITGLISASNVEITKIMNKRGGLLIMPVTRNNRAGSIVLEIPASVLPNNMDSVVLKAETVSVSMSENQIQIANYSLSRNSAYSMISEKYSRSKFNYVVELSAKYNEYGEDLFKHGYHNIPTNLFNNTADTYASLYIPYFSGDTGSNLVKTDDGEYLNASTIKAFVLDESKLMWRPVVTGLNKSVPSKGYVEVKLQHLSLYTIAGLKTAPAAVVEPIKVYPNPYRPNSGGAGHQHYIWFGNVPETVETIEIYDIAGELVTTLSRVDNLVEGIDGIKPPGAHWTATNAFGDAVASGIYIFRGIDKNGQTVKSTMGKIAVIK